ncbi:MAG: hypothetical protein IJ364_01355, partial [Oscillospiraceae bacterium]|nr:hypothetical protein [Oscillospiraceae bacterium]
MDNSLLIQYLTIGISILALISSVLIGVNQVKISKLQTDMQNKVELYLLSEPITLRKADGTVQDKIVPGIIIRNIGKSIKKINDLQNENEKLKAKINAL